jgi:hypothetical protein
MVSNDRYGNQCCTGEWEAKDFQVQYIEHTDEFTDNFRITEHGIYVELI